MTTITAELGGQGGAGVAKRVLGSSEAKLADMDDMPSEKGGGAAVTRLVKPQSPRGAAQWIEHVGVGAGHSAWFGSLHFHVHCGFAHLLSQDSAHSVLHFGGAQTVWH